MKRVTFTSKPKARAPGSDHWVTQRAGTNASEPSKRLTIDISFELHREMKVQCAVRGERMADVVRELLEQRFGAGQGAGGTGEPAPVAGAGGSDHETAGAPGSV